MKGTGRPETGLLGLLQALGLPWAGPRAQPRLPGELCPLPLTVPAGRGVKTQCEGVGGGAYELGMPVAGSS